METSNLESENVNPMDMDIIEFEDSIKQELM